MKVSVKLADLLLYDIPNVRLAAVQIDIYTTFRDAGGASTQQCILSSVFRRDVIADLDWEATPPEEIIRIVGGHYRLNEWGVAQPIDPDSLPLDRPSPNGAVAS
jgi:hypothetical protein